MPAFRKMLAKYRGATATNYIFQSLKSSDIASPKVGRYPNEPEETSSTTSCEQRANFLRERITSSSREAKCRPA